MAFYSDISVTLLGSDGHALIEFNIKLEFYLLFKGENFYKLLVASMFIFLLFCIMAVSILVPKLCKSLAGGVLMIDESLLNIMSSNKIVNCFLLYGINMLIFFASVYAAFSKSVLSVLSCYYFRLKAINYDITILVSNLTPFYYIFYYSA